MKRFILNILLLMVHISVAQNGISHEVNAFQKGEWLRFDISYSNFISAGTATLQVKETTYNGQDTFHVIGKGKTTGVISWFFKVKDNYQTYFSKRSLLPFRFIRKVNEGGYTKDKEIFFNHSTLKALVRDYKHDKESTHNMEKDVQDMLSTLYYLRNADITNLEPGEEVALTMFFDQENYKFKIRFLGREVIRTRFGKVATVKFMPIVQKGRVFKEQESVTVWISDDENKIPLRVKASLAVGSLRADLDAYKGLANPFPIIFN